MPDVVCATGGGAGGTPPTSLAGALLTVGAGAATALPDGTLTVANLATVMQEEDPCGVLTPSGGGVLVNEDGHYSVAGQIRPVRNGGAIDRAAAELRLNGTTVAWDDMHGHNAQSVYIAGQGVTLRPGWTGWLNAGDLITIHALSDGSAGTIEAVALENYLSVVWLGENQDLETGGVWP